MLFRERPSVIARWPAWELELLDHFFDREPAAIDRVEIAIARLTALYGAVHKPAGAKDPKLSDYLPHLNAWLPPQDDARYSELDREYLTELL